MKTVSKLNLNTTCVITIICIKSNDRPFKDTGEVQMGKVYGYCRISRRSQSIDRQVRNIKEQYPDAIIIREAFTGTSIERPAWQRLYKALREGDTVVFDSVSRMSRDAEEGSHTYTDLFARGVELVFLKEHYIDTVTYKNALQGKIELTGTDIDLILDGINKYLLRLAEDQIRLAFAQSEKEVQDLRQRTREGIETARISGKQIGGVSGRKLTTKKSVAVKEQIRKYSRDFDGTLSDLDVMRLASVARNTYYKYKRELKDEQIQQL